MRRAVAIASIAFVFVLSACSPRPLTTPVAEAAVIVPNVIGLAGDEARDAIESASLEVEWDEDSGFVIVASNWTVDAQSPAAGAAVAEGATVILTVSKHEDVSGPEEEAAAEEEKPAVPDVTLPQQQAIRKAESYLNVLAFSRTGLIDQLEFDGFSTDDATFAVDHVTVDWNEQAALKAQSYIDLMAFSRQGLIDQLIFDGFTPDQATYGVQAIGY